MQPQQLDRILSGKQKRGASASTLSRIAGFLGWPVEELVGPSGDIIVQNGNVHILEGTHAMSHSYQSRGGTEHPRPATDPKTAEVLAKMPSSTVVPKHLQATVPLWAVLVLEAAHNLGVPCEPKDKNIAEAYALMAYEVLGKFLIPGLQSEYERQIAQNRD